MKFIYSKFIGTDLGIVRLGGSGLGNLLFPFARSVVTAEKLDLPMIWPTWTGIMPKIIFSREKDKRLYLNLFKSNDQYITGIRKLHLLRNAQFFPEHKIEEFLKFKGDAILVFDGMDKLFTPMLENSVDVKESIQNILSKQSSKHIENLGNKVAIHVRLGDFQKASETKLLEGASSTSIPIDWYIGMVKQLRDRVDDGLEFEVFSDGTRDELAPLLSLKGVNLHKSFNSISDILSMSTAKLFIASGSSFSLWVRYLGQMPSINYPNQIKQRIFEQSDTLNELEVVREIPKENIEFYKEIFIRTRLENE